MTPAEIYNATRAAIDCARDPRRCLQPFAPGPRGDLSPYIKTPDEETPPGPPNVIEPPPPPSITVKPPGWGTPIYTGLKSDADQFGSASLGLPFASIAGPDTPDGDVTIISKYKSPDVTGVSDTFANGLIEAHWQNTLAGTWEESNGAIRAVTQTAGYTILLQEHAFGTEQRATFTLPAGTPPGAIGVIVCGSGTSGANFNGYCVIVDVDDSVRVYSVSAGVFTELDATTFPYTDGEAITLQASSGGQVQLWFEGEGTPAIDVADATHRNGGRTGIISDEVGAEITSFASDENLVS